MKHLKALFQPSRSYDVVTALRAIPSMPSFTMTEVRGFPAACHNRVGGHQRLDPINSLEMVEIECVVTRGLISRVVDAVKTAVGPCQPDDCRIVVTEAEEVGVARSTR